MMHTIVGRQTTYQVIPLVEKWNAVYVQVLCTVCEEYMYVCVHIFNKKYFKDVSHEFDEFQVNTHLCKLRCWYW